MKRLLPLLLLFLSPLALAVNPAVGGHFISAYIGAVGPYTTTAVATSISGSSFVVFVSQGAGGSGIPSSVTDSNSNTYTRITLGSGTNPIEDVNDGEYLSVYVCLNCVGSASHTVTVTGTDNLREVDFLEITNSTSIDISASGYNGGTGSTVSVPVVSTVANDLIAAAAITATASITVAPQTAGWTALDSTAGVVSQGSGYLAGATAASHDALMGRASGTTALAGITIAFKPSGAGPTNSPSQFFLGASLWQRTVSLEAMAH